MRAAYAQRMLGARTFTGLNADEWQAVGTMLTAALTAGLLLYAYVQVRQAKRAQDDRTRPFLIVDFHFRSQLISLAVKNVGETAATNVRVTLDEEVTSAVTPDVAWQRSPLFTKGMPLFAPGREMRFVLDVFSRRHETGLPTEIRGTITYQRPHAAGKPIVEPFLLDLDGFSEALLPPKDISDLADEVEKIRRLLGSWPPDTSRNSIAE